MENISDYYMSYNMLMTHLFRTFLLLIILTDVMVRNILTLYVMHKDILIYGNILRGC